MPRTKKQNEAGTAGNGPAAQAEAVAAVDVLTLAEAAAYLRVSEKDVLVAAATQGLPGRMIGAEWRSTKEAIREWLNVSQPSDDVRRAALQAAAGAAKDDPDVEDVVEEIYKRRGRPITEDGSYRLFHGLNPEDFPK